MPFIYDVRVEYLGNWSVVTLLTARAEEWVRSNVPNPVMISRAGLMIESASLDRLLEAMIDDGLEAPYVRQTFGDLTKKNDKRS